MTSLMGSREDALDQLADLEVFGADALDGRDGAVEDVVAALELAGTLDGQDVERLFDDAQHAGLSGRGRRRPGRDRLGVGDVVAVGAEAGVFLESARAAGQVTRLLLFAAEQEEGQARGGFGPDAGQAARTHR